MTGMDGAKAFLAAIGRSEGEMHDGIRSIRTFDDASREERVSYSVLKQKSKVLLEQIEDLRVDLDTWIIDYEDARNG